MLVSTGGRGGGRRSAVVGAALRWERLSRRRWAGVGLGVVGVAVTLSGRLGRPPTLAALAWTLCGLAGLAAGTILQGRLRTGAGPAALASTEVAAATLVMAVWAPLGGSLAIPTTARAIDSLLWIAIIPGVGGPLLFFALIRQRGATRASSLLFVVPAVTAIAAWPILGTPVGATTVLGLAVAGTGLWLSRTTTDGRQPQIPREGQGSSAVHRSLLPGTAMAMVERGRAAVVGSRSGNQHVQR
jgi:drug/metabolite transporter (DMT)-like permease